MKGKIRILAAALAVFLSVTCEAVDQRIYAFADGSSDARGYSNGTGMSLQAEDPVQLGTSARRSLLKFDTTHFAAHEMRGATLNLFGGRLTTGGLPTLNIYHYDDDSWTESRIPYPSTSGNLLLSAQVATFAGDSPHRYPQHSFQIGYNLPSDDDNDLLSVALVASGGHVSFSSRNTVNWNGSQGRNEPYIDFRSWGMTTLANSSFDGTFDDWVVENGNGLVEVVLDPRHPGYVAKMTTGSPVSLMQTLDTPEDDFYVLFDYEFLTDTGSLELTLTDREGTTSVIGTMDAPMTLPGTMSSTAFHVDDPSLLYLDGVELGITFDGTAGSQVLLDNIQFSDTIPEPSSVLMLMAGAGCMMAYRRLKTTRKDALPPRDKSMKDSRTF